jgi:hypothetical protein
VIEYTFEAESKAVASLANALARHILPLFTEISGGKPKLVGSGFLVTSCSSTYLISAAHVFDELKLGHELFFYIEPHTKRKLSGKIHLTKLPEGKGRKHDRFDVGVLKLEEPGLPPYPKVGKHSLTIDALMPRALPRDGKSYLIVGFPESKSRANPNAREVVSEIYSFRNISAPISNYAALGVSPESHVVISFDRKRTIGPDKKIRAFPEPSGISGSPVWLLYDENGPNDPNQTPVIGIAIEYHKNHRAIIATDIDVALWLINGTDWQ